MWRQHGPEEDRGIQEPEVKPKKRLSEMVPLAGFLYLSVPEVTLPSGEPDGGLELGRMATSRASDLVATRSLAGHFAP